MWGESSKHCEVNCQCSGLITENFTINSGNNGTKRKQDEAATTNYKLKMNPHSLDFKSPSSPIATPSKRRILGEIQNQSLSPLFRPKSEDMEPVSPLFRPKSADRQTISSIFRPKNEEKPTKSPLLRPKNSPINENSHNLSIGSLFRKNSPSIERLKPMEFKSPLLDRVKAPIERKSPIIDNNTTSPLTSRFKRSSTKISRIFEERSRFKMSNKENESSFISETFVKLDMEEETRDCSFGGFTSHSETKVTNWSMTKLDFTDALQTKSYEMEQTETDTINDIFVPEKDMETNLEPDFETLHDLEEEFEADNFDQCTKYEIISTDSPNIISRGRSSTSRKVNSRNFVFGAPLADVEQSTSFNNKPSVNTTRMLSFEDETFEFTSPAARRPSSTFSVKKSLKFNETPTKNLFNDTPTKNPLRHEPSDSSIGSMTSSPCSSHLRIFTSESTTSMESGFISELEEPFLELEDMSNSPKLANFDDLLSGQIKDNIITDKNFKRRPPLHRSLSFNPEPKAKVSLFSIEESAEERKTQKRTEVSDFDNVANKKRKSNGSPELEKPRVPRPVLQRAFSENHASIMSALARSATEPDLIGDFSLPYALPLLGGDHPDLKSISSETLATLIRGGFHDTVSKYQVIDCRYPYEFEGGHIPGALNLHTPAQIQGLLNRPLQTRDSDAKRHILVFHCEFSLERGPKLYRYLRSSDRSKNMENYPNLNFPEVYLLHKGYRTFFQKYPELCTPAGYTAMLDPEHTHLLRKHRSVGEISSSNLPQRKSSKAGHRLLY